MEATQNREHFGVKCTWVPATKYFRANLLYKDKAGFGGLMSLIGTGGTLVKALHDLSAKVFAFDLDKFPHRACSQVFPLK